MRIAVCVKWALDFEYPFRAGPEGVELNADDTPRMPSPWDMVACEAAVRLKEAFGGEVDVYSAGPPEAEKAVREGLALGADSGTLVTLESAAVAGAAAAALIAGAIARNGSPDLVLCSARSPDSGSGVVPAALAERLDASLVCNAVRLEPLATGGIVVERRLDGGHREILEVELPAVVSVEPSLCQPRYPTLLARRKAQTAAITVLSPADLEVRLPQATLRVVAMGAPRPRNARLVEPPAGLSARERIRFILAGGIERRGDARRLEGTPEVVVAGLIDFFRANAIGTP